jgi:hypothetical protein
LHPWRLHGSATVLVASKRNGDEPVASVGVPPTEFTARRVSFYFAGIFLAQFTAIWRNLPRTASSRIGWKTVNFAAYEGRPNNARTELDRAVFGLLKMRNYLELTWKSTTYATPPPSPRLPPPLKLRRDKMARQARLCFKSLPGRLRETLFLLIFGHNWSKSVGWLRAV